ncbi:MAG: GNAT family N-acetyltransferase [Chloroflexota bacterium]|nr:GNAT family N-acetyltransferase [Chloroflexota bacterium]
MSNAAPPLETGHEPTTPIGDTLLRRFLCNWTEAIDALATSMGGRTLRRDDLHATDVGRPAGYANAATLLRPLTSASVDEVLAELAGFYGFGGDAGGEVVLFSPWPTPDLRSHGWSLMGHPPLHLLAPGRSLPPPPPGLRIDEVRDAAALRAWEAAAGAGFPFPEWDSLGPGSLIGEGVLGDPRWRLWTGWLEDRPVSIAAAFVEHGISNVVLVATVPEARRRGYGEAVTWRAALAEPGLPAMLLSSDPGRPVYERMGFLPLFRFTLWYRDRP